MTTVKLAALAALAATASVALAGFAPAAGMAKATGPGKYSVAKTTYVYEDPGVHFTGTMFKNETFKVERVSKSGKNAYGVAYGHVNRHVWIDARLLTAKK